MHTAFGRLHCRHCPGLGGPCECSHGCPVVNWPFRTCKCFPVNRGITCASCGLFDFPGARFKCQVCNNFDLCQDCFARGHHDLTHGFLKFKAPGRPPVLVNARNDAGSTIPTIAASWVIPQDTTNCTPSSASVLVPFAEVTVLDSAPDVVVLSSVVDVAPSLQGDVQECNYCGESNYQSIRFKCQTCANVNLCQSCVREGLHDKRHVVAQVVGDDSTQSSRQESLRNSDLGGSDRSGHLPSSVSNFATSQPSIKGFCHRTEAKSLSKITSGSSVRDRFTSVETGSSVCSNSKERSARSSANYEMTSTPSVREGSFREQTGSSVCSNSIGSIRSSASCELRDKNSVRNSSTREQAGHSVCSRSTTSSCESNYDSSSKNRRKFSYPKPLMPNSGTGTSISYDANDQKPTPAPTQQDMVSPVRGVPSLIASQPNANMGQAFDTKHLRGADSHDLFTAEQHVGRTVMEATTNLTAQSRVKVPKPTQPLETNIEVFCDGLKCNGSTQIIVGPRFTCDTCVYRVDLCESCYMSKTAHNALHSFRRYDPPNSLEFTLCEPHLPSNRFQRTQLTNGFAQERDQESHHNEHALPEKSNVAMQHTRPSPSMATVPYPPRSRPFPTSDLVPKERPLEFPSATTFRATSTGANELYSRSGNSSSNVLPFSAIKFPSSEVQSLSTTKSHAGRTQNGVQLMPQSTIIPISTAALRTESFCDGPRCQQAMHCIVGPVYRCANCQPCVNLCEACYMSKRAHNASHSFKRFDQPNSLEFTVCLPFIPSKQAPSSRSCEGTVLVPLQEDDPSAMNRGNKTSQLSNDDTANVRTSASSRNDNSHRRHNETSQQTSRHPRKAHPQPSNITTIIARPHGPPSRGRLSTTSNPVVPSPYVHPPGLHTRPPNGRPSAGAPVPLYAAAAGTSTEQLKAKAARMERLRNELARLEAEAKERRYRAIERANEELMNQLQQQKQQQEEIADASDAGNGYVDQTPYQDDNDTSDDDENCEDGNYVEENDAFDEEDICPEEGFDEGEGFVQSNAEYPEEECVEEQDFVQSNAEYPVNVEEQEFVQYNAEYPVSDEEQESVQYHAEYTQDYGINEAYNCQEEDSGDY